MNLLDRSFAVIWAFTTVVWAFTAVLRAFMVVWAFSVLRALTVVLRVVPWRGIDVHEQKGK